MTKTTARMDCELVLQQGPCGLHVYIAARGDPSLQPACRPTVSKDSPPPPLQWPGEVDLALEFEGGKAKAWHHQKFPLLVCDGFAMLRTFASITPRMSNKGQALN